MAEVDVGATPASFTKKFIYVAWGLRAANAMDAARIVENVTRDKGIDLVILDEADRLNHQALEMVRSIYDRTGVPILLIGMTDIVRNLRSHKKFYSRVGIAYHFEPLSFEQLVECSPKLHPLFNGTNGELDRPILDFVFHSTRGEFRRIERLVSQANRLRVANDQSSFSLGLFQTAASLLLGPEPSGVFA